MPTPANAFDFEDNPSGSDDELPRIPRRVNTRNTVALIVAMTGNTKVDKDTRMNQSNTRNQIKCAQASNNEDPNSEGEIKKLSEDEINREKQKHEREARKQRTNDKSAHQQKTDDFLTSCPDEVLSERLWSPNPGGKFHCPWDRYMIRQEVAPDGN